MKLEIKLPTSADKNPPIGPSITPSKGSIAIIHRLQIPGTRPKIVWRAAKIATRDTRRDALRRKVDIYRFLGKLLYLFLKIIRELFNR